MSSKIIVTAALCFFFFGLGATIGRYNALSPEEDTSTTSYSGLEQVAINPPSVDAAESEPTPEIPYIEGEFFGVIIDDYLCWFKKPREIPGSSVSRYACVEPAYGVDK